MSQDSNAMQTNTSASQAAFDPPRNRRKLIILPKVQLVMATYSLAISMFFFGVVVLATKLSIDQIRNADAAKNLPPDHLFYKFLDAQQHMILTFVLVGSLLFFVINFLVSLYLSRKFAGPLIGLKRRFEEMRDTGQIKRFEFRDEDAFMREIVAPFNTLVDKKSVDSATK